MPRDEPRARSAPAWAQSWYGYLVVLIDPHHAARRVSIGWFGAVVYPWLILGALYGAWLMAWLVLGHVPRLYIDDPKGLGSLVRIASILPGILLYLSPAAFAVGLGLSLVFAALKLHKRGKQLVGFSVLLATALSINWGFALVVFRWDPGGVGDWWLD